MRYRGTALVGIISTLLVAAAVVPAQAEEKETFESVSTGAVRVDRAGLGGLLWALSASCDEGDELDKRQCRAVRNARARKVEGQTFVVPGDASAFTVGAFDNKKKSAPLAVSGCIACIEPITIGGSSYYVLSNKAPASFTGSVARAGEIHETSRTFADNEASVRWRTEVVPRLRTEFVIKLGEGATWTKDGKQGLAVEILGFRVWDPCDGGIVCASPKSGKAGVDKVACGGAVVEGEAEGGDGGGEIVDTGNDKLPEDLTAKQIKLVMRAVRVAADDCYGTYGVAGDAKLNITVAGDGAVIAIEQTGDFEDTPTGACIEKAAKVLTFPKTSKKKQSFKYPIILR